MKKPKVALVADVRGWAWERKSQHLQRWLTDEFEMEIVYHTDGGVPKGFDLYHTFEFPQIDRVPEGARAVTGITAHVMSTWGDGRVRQWADKAVGIHANSVLLFNEIKPFHSFCYYTPNGVCPEQFTRTRPPPERLVVGHVAKGNPRKGRQIIQEACRLARVEFKPLCNSFSDAISVNQMVKWYQDVNCIAVASDMDGTPNPALEGAACECVIVTNAIGNMPEFIQWGVNGFLVDRDAGALALALGWLAEHPEERIIMGKAARETVLKGWSWETQAEHYRQMWREVLS